jgi:hypothetical protein
MEGVAEGVWLRVEGLEFGVLVEVVSGVQDLLLPGGELPDCLPGFGLLACFVEEHTPTDLPT